MSPAIRAVFLDAGGTLIHLDAPFILGALAEQGLVRDAAAFARADRAARSAVARRLHSPLPGDDRTRWQLFARTLLAELGCTDAVAAAVRKALVTHNDAARLWGRAEAGTAAVLDRLHARGYILGVVSNSNGRVEEMLRNAGLRAHVDFVIDSARVGCEKPDPRIFEIACARAGVVAAEAVHVGDVYEIDVVGARRAGITPVLLDADDFMPGADCPRIHALDELVEWLSNGAP
jgi:putative hydrolase of the HAD superfamily